MTEVVVIRPGCTDFDLENRLQGALELPLNQRGTEQVDALAASLRPLGVEVLYSAAGDPSRTTAELLAEKLDLPMTELSELTNLNLGLWQGLTAEEVRRKSPKIYKQWHEAPETICPPGGEMVDAAVERIRRALNRPLKRRGIVGIVAPEPLATVIGCVIRGMRPQLPERACGGGMIPPVAILTCSSESGSGEWSEVLLPAAGVGHTDAAMLARGLETSRCSPSGELP